MAETTKIEWCDATLNLWWGCTKVSDGCKFCYADAWSKRHGRAVWGPGGTRVEVKSWRSELNKVSKRAKAEGRRLRVFCQSMSDTFEGPETCGGHDSENWRLMSRLRKELWEAIYHHPELDFLLLTKRPENIEYCVRGVATNYAVGFGPNVWLGTSVENQEQADNRIPELLKVPAAVRFLSCEPLLGPVDLERYATGWQCQDCGKIILPEECTFWERHDERKGGCGGECRPTDGISWVICGGESGPKARPMHPDWARSLRDQCQAAGVPFFMKQMGGSRKPFDMIPEDLLVRQFPQDAYGDSEESSSA